ncbi:MAG: SRPBCC domain-containing protein [Planctomycetes bacterium]|nr:SRPBCC domain-containing protein [Planctomycetota bacterium]
MMPRNTLLAISALCGWTAGVIAEQPPLVHEGIIRASVDQVWAAFTTKKGLESWMVPHAEIDLRVNGKMRTNYHADGAIGDPNTIENTILSFDPKRMLSLRATKPPANFPFKSAIKGTWSVMYFDALGPKRTRLRVIGLGYGTDEEATRMRAFFEMANAWTIRKLQEKFPAPADASGEQGTKKEE